MTLSRRSFARFATFGFAVLLLAAAAPDDARARTPRETIAYVPGAIWGAHLESAAGELGLRRDAVYWSEGERSMGRIIGDVERYSADDAKAAPHEPMVAFVGRFATYPSNTLLPGVAVMDTTGAMLADFPRGRGFSWSPDGTRLAVLFAKEPLPRGRRAAKGRVRYRPGVTVWDRRDGRMRTFQQWPSRVAWAGDDSLLLQLRDSVVAVDMRSGRLAATAYRGAILSPDGRYALRPGEGGEDTRIFYAGARIEDEVLGRYARRHLGQIRSAFWVRARGADHLMCVSACDAIQRERPSCRTDIVDVETGETVESFTGEALGPTADERGVVVFRRGRGRLEYHDLRPVARERRTATVREGNTETDREGIDEPPAVDPGMLDRDENELPAHGDPESGEFY